MSGWPCWVCGKPVPSMGGLCSPECEKRDSANKEPHAVFDECADFLLEAIARLKHRKDRIMRRDEPWTCGKSTREGDAELASICRALAALVGR